MHNYGADREAAYRRGHCLQPAHHISGDWVWSPANSFHDWVLLVASWHLPPACFMAIMQLVVVKKGEHAFGKVFTRRVACVASTNIWIASIGACECLVASHYCNRSISIYDSVIRACDFHILNSTLLNGTFLSALRFEYSLLSLEHASATWLPCGLCDLMYLLILNRNPGYKKKYWNRAVKLKDSSETDLFNKEDHCPNAAVYDSQSPRRSLIGFEYLFSNEPTLRLSTSCHRGIHSRNSSIFPSVIISHGMQRRACCLLLTGRYKESRQNWEEIKQWVVSQHNKNNNNQMMKEAYLLLLQCS